MTNKGYDAATNCKEIVTDAKAITLSKNRVEKAGAYQ